MTCLKCMSFLLLLALGLARPSAGVKDVFVVPHSHCDAGWLLTAQQYFEKWPNASQHSGGSVHAILDTVTDVLSTNPEARFVWSETIWFEKWWALQDPSTKEKFKKIVASKQLQFVGGGYVQNDEVTATFNDVIDQTTTGHEFLRKTLNYTVKYGWQIDMFAGYSGVTPTLWALAGYDGMVTRFEGNTTLRDIWIKNKAYEYVWRASRSLPVQQTQILNHVINGNYGDIMGVGFDWENPDTKKNPAINSTNIASRAALFTQFVHNRSVAYQGPYMAVWGADFHFHHAQVQFGNMTLLMDYINQHQETYGLKMRYSTVEEYFEHLLAVGLKFPVVDGLDFELGWPHEVPAYAHVLSYQTGCLTTWAHFKQLIRTTDSYGRAAEAVFALSVASDRARSSANSTTVSLDPVLVIRNARALVQHHDSIPGTMRTNVSSDAHYYIGPADVKKDYEDHLFAALESARALLEEGIGKLAAYGSGKSPPVLLALNASVPFPTSPSLASSAEEGTLAVFNPLAWERTTAVSVRLPSQAASSGAGGSPSVTVVDSNGNEVASQLDQQGMLWFLAELPPLGYAAFSVTIKAGGGAAQRMQTASAASPQLLQNDFLAVYVGGSCHMQAVYDKRGGVNVTVKHDMAQYLNGIGGAYILFETQAAQPSGPVMDCLMTTGPLYHEVCADYAGNGGVQSVCTRVYQTTDPLLGGFVRVHHVVGPLTAKQEVVSRFSTDFDAEHQWHTDDSGLEMHKRTFNKSLSLPGNYHALVSSTFIRPTAAGKDAQLSIISPHTSGVTSALNGQLEVMLLRRQNSSDTQGPYPVDDRSVLHMPLWVLAGNQTHSEALRVKLVLMMTNPAVVLGSPLPFRSWSSAYATSYSPLQSPLPYAVDMMTLNVRGGPVTDIGSEYFLRLRHIYEAGAHPTLSQPVNISLGALFQYPLNASSPVQTTLTLAQRLSDLNRIVWPTQSHDAAAASDECTATSPTDGQVTLCAEQMGTFVTGM